MFRTIPNDISLAAKELHEQLLKQERLDPRISDMLQGIANGQLQLPDDWALVQECLDQQHPCAVFFKKYRNQISRQLIIAEKHCTAVSIVSFSYQGERYVLLMKNEGQAASPAGEIQWTTHGFRVDQQEQALLKDKNRWKLYEKASGFNHDLIPFIAAIVRQIESMGIVLDDDMIENIHPIDRNASGLIEAAHNYRTEHFDIYIGERNPNDLMAACRSSTSTRFGHWTHCFKLSELQTYVQEEAQESKATHSQQSQHFSFTYQGEKHTLRETTWFFINALKLVKEFEIKPESDNKNPWELRDVNPIETAIRWVRQRVDHSVQFTLFSDQNNRLSSAQLQVFAAKTKLDPEELAYKSLKPERLMLHAIIACLTVNTRIENTRILENRVHELYNEFFNQQTSIKQEWEATFQTIKSNLNEIVRNHLNGSHQEISAEEKEDIARILTLSKTAETTKLNSQYHCIYHLSESAIDIAMTIRLHEKYHACMMPELLMKARQLIESKNYEPLIRYPLNSRQCFGITGPPASGKSVSEKMIRSALGDSHAAFIGSDEWNQLLSQNLNLDPSKFMMIRGKLTLPEAWFIKVLIWDLIKVMEADDFGFAPNTIQEALNPAAIKAPLQATTTIYINTSDPSKAADRVKERGDKEGRYVSASMTTGAYRWPWLQLLKTLEKPSDQVTLKIIDTDIMYAKENSHLSAANRMHLANIATIQNKTLDIHNLHHFLFFVARSYRVNPCPKMISEIWKTPKTAYFSSTWKEIKKLFSAPFNMNIAYQGKQLSADALLNLILKSYRSVKAVENSYLHRKQMRFFRCDKDTDKTVSLVQEDRAQHVTMKR
jgi:hypothetical protein